jgi:hypothetical protein
LAPRVSYLKVRVVERRRDVARDTDDVLKWKWSLSLEAPLQEPATYGVT